MTELLSYKSLLEKALRIEHQGTAFYDTIARSANSDVVAELFNNMVDKCHHHIDILQTLYDKTSQDAGAETRGRTQSVQAKASFGWHRRLYRRGCVGRYAGRAGPATFHDGQRLVGHGVDARARERGIPGTCQGEGYGKTENFTGS